MATEEPVHDISLDSITPSNIEAENNESTSPGDASAVPSSDTNADGTITGEERTTEQSEDSASAPKSPSKPKASVTTDAKKALRGAASTLKTAPANAVKK
ncbi:hypothetical protein FRC16_003348, partial [Serendipita sp. 398]